MSVSLGKDPAVRRISAYVLPSLSAPLALHPALLLCIIFTSLAFQKSHLYESCVAGALVSLSLLGYETRAAQPGRPTHPHPTPPQPPLPYIAYKLTKQTLGQPWGTSTVNENVKDQRNMLWFLERRISIAITRDMTDERDQKMNKSWGENKYIQSKLGVLLPTLVWFQNTTDEPDSHAHMQRFQWPND